ncbi:MAG: hypothetical protein A3C27_00735 [Candidatus Levybacteria bacterium RIFCSPHIGHO2_02_FULL_39_36]|nr:MAG: hypothetical protein A2689_00820 [Candidatus Levybacteria bacterium RIFCSPHIGHO2_01_FULL_38_96]OGH25516.1 MAG: hypothetical protein A3E68_02465 [Candidatus Levybacteria bacterium RIFCSPHIGHO2_12_FULL_39_39]OGH28897.1 MAG: hypothetical protein A3C27_00735 [Candidatus Levybacteria bacterium RIFCSPHIGHO2_02_FULL_39_36]OGH36137.1 MAG: hypothetical protein A3B43_01140 [Candidatus Levybacteria bacterium RIFCSPLOWO2_01_FULL_38_120]OGH45123.1 MAG: hypothetical protein A3H82_01155 [Candidatus Le
MKYPPVLLLFLQTIHSSSSCKFHFQLLLPDIRPIIYLISHQVVAIQAPIFRYFDLLIRFQVSHLPKVILAIPSPIQEAKKHFLLSIVFVPQDSLL